MHACMLRVSGYRPSLANDMECFFLIKVLIHREVNAAIYVEHNNVYNYMLCHVNRVSSLVMSLNFFSRKPSHELRRQECDRNEERCIIMFLSIIIWLLQQHSLEWYIHWSRYSGLSKLINIAVKLWVAFIAWNWGYKTGTEATRLGLKLQDWDWGYRPGAAWIQWWLPMTDMTLE